MEAATRKKRITFVVALVMLITALHYTTGQGRLYFRLYRDFYYLPLIMAGLWFGLRGALLTSVSITILFLPFMVMTWQHVPLLDLDRFLEIALLNVVAAVLGIITDRERASSEGARRCKGPCRNRKGSCRGCPRHKSTAYRHRWLHTACSRASAR